jgi:hypothetical protein
MRPKRDCVCRILGRGSCFVRSAALAPAVAVAVFTIRSGRIGNAGSSRSRIGARHRRVMAVRELSFRGVARLPGKPLPLRRSFGISPEGSRLITAHSHSASGAFASRARERMKSECKKFSMETIKGSPRSSKMATYDVPVQYGDAGLMTTVPRSMREMASGRKKSIPNMLGKGAPSLLLLFSPPACPCRSSWRSLCGAWTRGRARGGGGRAPSRGAGTSPRPSGTGTCC